VAGAEHGEDHPAEEEHHDIHMPDPSYFPLVAALGLPVIGYGLIYLWPVAIVGALITMAGLFGWSLEPVAEEA
jgi:cytochrome c oxidase subunit 1